MIDVVFMGTPDYAESILQQIINTDDMKVVAVYTQPDKPVGRKKVMTPPEVKVLAEENNIDIYQPTRLRDADTVKELLKIECDFIVESENKISQLIQVTSSLKDGKTRKRELRVFSKTIEELQLKDVQCIVACEDNSDDIVFDGMNIKVINIKQWLSYDSPSK